MQAHYENCASADKAQLFFTPLQQKPHEAQQFLLSPGAEESFPCLQKQKEPLLPSTETPPAGRAQDQARQIAELQRTLKLQTVELAELAELHGSQTVDPNNSWEQLGVRPVDTDSFRTEAHSSHIGELEELRKRNQQLEASVKDLAEFQEKSKALQDQHAKFDAQEREFFKLKETADLQKTELVDIRRENLRMEAQSEEVSRMAERREQQIAKLHEEIGALRQEKKHLEFECAEARELQQEDNRRLHSRERQVEELRELVNQQAAELDHLHQDRAVLHSGISETTSASKAKRDIFSARHNSSIEPVPEIATDCLDTDDNKENEGNPSTKDHKRLRFRKPALGAKETQRHVERDSRDAARVLSDMQETSRSVNRSRQVEDISEVLCDDASAMTTPMRRLTDQESTEFPNVSGRLWQQLEDPLELSYTSEEPTARSAHGRQLAPQRTQRARKDIEGGNQDSSRRQRHGWITDEDAGWSLTSLSGSSGGREAARTVTPSSAGGVAAPTFLEREVAGLCGAVVDEPWRLVCAVLGVLDAMQKKFGTATEESHKAACRSGEWWRSVQTIDIRVLVAVEGGAVATTEESSETCRDSTETQGQSLLKGGTFMYVLV